MNSQGLYYLQSDDFLVRTSSKGTTLCNNIEGFSLVLFYSNKCEHSQALLPIFKKLPNNVNQCIFGLINVTLNKEVVKMSKGTLAEIKYVPLILLFIDGKPYMRYDGEPVLEELVNFVIAISQQVRKKPSQQQEEPPHQQQYQQQQVCLMLGMSHLFLSEHHQDSQLKF